MGAKAERQKINRIKEVLAETGHTGKWLAEQLGKDPVTVSKWDIINKVYSKLCNQPNSTYNQLWLQNITYQKDKKNGVSPYTLRLCRLAAGRQVEPLWNNEWLKPELLTDIPYDTIVDGEILKKVTPVITFRERRRYEELY